jgi:eukaryotic-like serine/threonine-protein kinase
MNDRRSIGNDETRSSAKADAESDPFDMVAEEFVERCRRGESPSITEYEQRFPEHARRIRNLLPSVAMMEQLKRRVRSTRDAESGWSESFPDRMGEYRLIRELGRGGMGIVYEAVQESLGRHVALKVIPRHGVLDAKRRMRFQREAQAVAKLHHTNIVPIFAVGEHEGLPYYAMQYIRGDGLDQLLERWREGASRRDEAHWRFVARVGIQAADALQYAHDQGILHRDIKPANLLIDEHQVAWITDFGLAKLIGRDDLTNSGDVIGTLRYLAPEALRGQTDHRGDIYSLGLTLYEVLTLQPPFGDLSPSELLRCVTEEQPARPRSLDVSIPLDLETIILKATAREPGDRYATAGDLAEDLRSYLDDRPIRARRASRLEHFTRWCRRNKMVAAMTSVAVVTLLAATIIGWVLYAARSSALEFAEANGSLAFAALEDLFEKLANRGEFGPVFAGPGHGPPPGDHGPPPGDHRPPSGRPGSPQLASEVTENDAALYQSILEFYDKFAARNETNSRLQGEAARAHRKVAALYRWLGRDKEADEAQDRATQRFERLVARYPDVPEYRFGLARTYAMDDQDSPGSIKPERLEGGIRKALKLAERLADEAPDHLEYIMAMARWKARLGASLLQLHRSKEAEAAYRESIAHDEWLAGRLDDRPSVCMVMAPNREALARIVLESGRRDEAKDLLRLAEDELEAVESAESNHRFGGGYLAERLSGLAELYETLGDGVHAAELTDRVRRIRLRGPRNDPGGRGGRPPGPGDDRRRPGSPRQSR